MSRAVRITVGSVLVGVLAFVALVAGVMAASAGFEGDPFGFATDSVDTPASAEVLDVDDYGDGWPTVDVRWTTSDGEVVVTYVDWEWSDELPEVGDRVDVMYDPLDPEWAYAADDPVLQDGGTDDDAAAAEVEEQGGSGRVAGWVSLAALLGVVVGAVLTVVAAVRAPSASGPPRQPGLYEAPYPHLVGAGGPPHAQAHPQPHAQPYPQPYPSQAYPQQAYPQQAYPQQAYPQQAYPSQVQAPYAQQPAVPQQGHGTAAEPATGPQWSHPG